MQKRNTRKDVEEWQNLYEQIGNFKAISEYIKQRNKGYGPSDRTIVNRLKRKFKEERRDFDDWMYSFKRAYIRSPKYSTNDVEEWEKLYEELGSFITISNRIKERNNGVGPDDITVATRLKKKFEQEGKNFDEWVSIYSHYIEYSEKDVEEWQNLYEQIGNFKEVSKYLKNKDSHGPIDDTIIRRLKVKFNQEGRDFNEWVKIYRNSRPQEFKEEYSEDEVEEWEKLFEKLGSFVAVSAYIKEKNDGNGPYFKTIIRRFKKKFEQEGKNFDEWVVEFYSLNTDIFASVGIYGHWILENIFMEHILETQKKGYFEIKPCVLDMDTIVDNTIIDVYQVIKMINIDYTISSRLNVILDKCYKNYQGPEKMLIIVILTSDKKISFPKNICIPYIQNIKILNAREFADFMGYEGESLSKYYYTQSLIKRAFYDEDSYNKLEELGKVAQVNLVQMLTSYEISQKDFEKYLKSNTNKDLTYLLRKSFSDANLDSFL